MNQSEELTKLNMSKYQNPYHGLISHRPKQAFLLSCNIIHQMDDEKIIISRKFGYRSLFITLAAGNFLILFMGIIRLDWGIALMALDGYLILGLLFLLHEKRFKATFEFNRKNHTVTFPRGLLGKGKTLPFSEVKLIIKHRLSPYVGPVKGAYYSHLRSKDDSVTSHDLDMNVPTAESWSWILWYMDRHRVLPPSEVLDSFRIRDAQRLRGLKDLEPLHRMTYYIESISRNFVESVKDLDLKPETPIEAVSEEPLDALIEKCK